MAPTTQSSRPATPRDLLNTALRIANDPWHTIWLCPLLLLANAVLTAGVIWKIPYTEIDWTTYNQQIALYLSGERNYAKITGSTGPLVYPAMHVHIYRLLHSVTSQGADVRLAQIIFAALYLATLAVVMQCYRLSRVPPWVYPLLILSKRLHSIYVLRLFNDCFAVFFLWACIYLLQTGRYRAGALAYSLGLGVKMSLLLALPAVGFVLYMAQGAGGALGSAVVMVQYQVLVAWPFVAKFPREYIGRAFEFGRRFEWKWTVNWRWVGREVFEDERFATALLAGHVVVLGSFVVGKWMRHAGVGVGEVVGSLLRPMSGAKMKTIQAKVTPEFVLTSILTANVIGMLFARSLHYQFYSWLVWGTPYLLWRSGQSPLAVVGAWVGQEVAWNIYPSTRNSSMIVVIWLAAQVYGSWMAPPVEELWKNQEQIIAGEEGPKIMGTPTAKKSGRSKETVDIDAVSSPRQAASPNGKRKSRKR
ncbi:ALG3-like protein [Elsinoe fawcettii]|nr:ALG3-like protein [Elsinoe fawcettii]